MKRVTARTIAADCGRSVEDIHREVRALWKAGEYDKKVFYTGLAKTAVIALLIALLLGIVNLYLDLPLIVLNIGTGIVIFIGFRAAIYASLEASVKKSLGGPGV